MGSSQGNGLGEWSCPAVSVVENSPGSVGGSCPALGMEHLSTLWTVMTRHDETRSQMHRVQSCDMSHHCSGCVTTSLCTNSVLLVVIVTAVDVSSADREAGRGGFNPVLVNNQVTQSTRVSVLYWWLPFPLCGVMVTGSVWTCMRVQWVG